MTSSSIGRLYSYSVLKQGSMCLIASWTSVSFVCAGRCQCSFLMLSCEVAADLKRIPRLQLFLCLPLLYRVSLQLQLVTRVGIAHFGEIAGNLEQTRVGFLSKFCLMSWNGGSSMRRKTCPDGHACCGHTNVILDLKTKSASEYAYQGFILAQARWLFCVPDC